MKNPGDSPHLVDLHVGQRIRCRRTELHMSQATLASAVGVTFQQTQKVERGVNRISASALYLTAQALGVPVGYFYQGLPVEPDRETKTDRSRRQFANSPLGQELIDAAMAVPPSIVETAAQFMRAVTEVVDGTALQAANAVSRAGRSAEMVT